MCEDGRIGRVELQLCGLTQPPMMSWASCEAHQLEVPDSVWDSPTMPRLVTTGALTDFAVGGVLSLTKASGWIGIVLPHPDAPWPSLDELASESPEHSFVDHDGDGRPGIAMRFAHTRMAYRDSGCGIGGTQPVTFQGPRPYFSDCLSDDGCERVTQVDVGLRTQLGTSGSIASCDDPSASIVGASSADSVSLAIAGCTISDGTSCSDASLEVLNASLEPYNILAEGGAPPDTALASPCDCPDGCTGSACPLDQTASAGPRSAMVRLGDADASERLDCAAVRGALANTAVD